jgi:hypothetical protein
LGSENSTAKEIIFNALSKGSAFAELIHHSMPEWQVGSLLSPVDVQPYDFCEAIVTISGILGLRAKLVST